MRLSSLRHVCLPAALVGSLFFTLDLGGDELDEQIRILEGTADEAGTEFAIESSESETEVNANLSNWLQEIQPPAITF